MTHHYSDDQQWITGVLQVLQHSSVLKTVKRKGWVDRGVDHPESVADHSYGLALAVLLLASRREDIDTERALILALIHDLPESIAGDITPFDDQLNDANAHLASIFAQSPEFSVDAHAKKKQAEAAAIEQLVTDTPDELQQLIREAWHEYEANTTPEAQFVRQLDKLETWLQALEYADQQPEIVIDSFRIGTDQVTEDHMLRSVLSEIAKRSHAAEPETEG